MSNETAVANAKQHCARIFQSLNMNPGSWKEEVLTGSFVASHSTLNCAKSVVATVASNGYYPVDVIHRDGYHVVSLAAGLIPGNSSTDACEAAQASTESDA